MTLIIPESFVVFLNVYRHGERAGEGGEGRGLRGYRLKAGQLRDTIGARPHN